MALIPPHFLDTVVAIGFGDDPEKRRWVGTGFLYGLFSHSDAEGRDAYFICLITNAHVLRDKPNVWLKFNKTGDEGSSDIQVPLVAGSERLWSVHPESDVAAFWINVNVLKSSGHQDSYFRSNKDVARTEDLAM